MLLPPPSSPLFPYTTLFRSVALLAPDSSSSAARLDVADPRRVQGGRVHAAPTGREVPSRDGVEPDRKSTRLNSSHITTSYAVFCLKKKNKINYIFNELYKYT